MSHEVVKHEMRSYQYDQNWLRFTSGTMHFVTQDQSVLPVILEPRADEAPVEERPEAVDQAYAPSHPPVLAARKIRKVKRPQR